MVGAALLPKGLGRHVLVEDDAGSPRLPPQPRARPRHHPATRSSSYPMVSIVSSTSTRRTAPPTRTCSSTVSRSPLSVRTAAMRRSRLSLGSRTVTCRPSQCANRRRGVRLLLRNRGRAAPRRGRWRPTVRAAAASTRARSRCQAPRRARRASTPRSGAVSDERRESSQGREREPDHSPGNPPYSAPPELPKCLRRAAEHDDPGLTSQCRN